jgi:hypothetical protein
VFLIAVEISLRATFTRTNKSGCLVNSRRSIGNVGIPVLRESELSPRWKSEMHGPEDSTSDLCCLRTAAEASGLGGHHAKRAVK